MTAEIFIAAGIIPIVFSLIACFFSNKRFEDEKINIIEVYLYKGVSMFFFFMTLISCLVIAAMVQNNWDTLIGGTQNMGNPLIVLMWIVVYVGGVIMAFDILFGILMNMYPKDMDKFMSKNKRASGLSKWKL